MLARVQPEQTNLAAILSSSNPYKRLKVMLRERVSLTQQLTATKTTTTTTKTISTKTTKTRSTKTTKTTTTKIMYLENGNVWKNENETF